MDLKALFKQQEIRRVKEFVELHKKEIESRELSWNEVFHEVFHEKLYTRVIYQSNIPSLPASATKEELDLRDELLLEIDSHLRQITDNPGPGCCVGLGVSWVFNIPFSSTESQL